MSLPTRTARSGRTQPGARIAGLGAYRPLTVVSNTQAAAPADVSAEWIVQRVGVRERRYADSAESVVTVAASAAKEAPANCGAGPWRVLTKLRLGVKWATRLVRALMILTQHEISR